MTRRLLPLLLLIAALAPATPAAAYWRTSGTGTGSGTTATMPTGATPTTSVSGKAVTVTFAQNQFQGSNLTNAGGGYTVLRYASGSSTPVTPNSACSGTITGTGSPLTCTESNVPYGDWVYRITPVLRTFTGDQGPISNIATVALGTPNLTSVTPANPATGATDGPIAVSWTAATNAAGYNVFRKLSTATTYGATPLNGSTPLTTLTFSDTTATGAQTYDYVVRAVDGTQVSADSNQRSGKVITRPAAPTTATATSGTAAITVTWGSVAAAAGYNVYRRTSTGSFDFTAPLNGSTPVTALTFKDSTAVAGTTYVYGIRSEVPGTGTTQVESSTTKETANGSCASTYSSSILNAGPLAYFRLADAAGSTSAANAQTGSPTASYNGGVTFGVAGALTCDTNAAITLDGTTGYISPNASTTATAGPTTFSTQVWFKTSVGGGKLIGYGNQRTGVSNVYDRHTYLTDAGNVVFGVYPNTVKTIVSPLEYDDDKWHMAVSTFGAAGMHLYIDGAEVAADTTTTTAETTTGFWRVGYDNLDSWTSQPANRFFKGSLDEVAIYGTQLPASTIANQYAAGRP